MMDVQPRRRRIARAVPVLWVTALAAVCFSASAIAAVSSSKSDVATQSLAGKWHGHYGGAVSGSFTLTWQKKRSKLSGSIKLSNPKGKYGINDSVHGMKIKFGAVGVGATYKGSLSGNSMSGTWNSPEGGGSWSAHKVMPKS